MGEKKEVEFEIDFTDALNEEDWRDYHDHVDRGDDYEDESDPRVPVENRLIGEMRALGKALENQNNRNDGIFNKMFSFLERLAIEVEDIQRTVYQRDNIENHDVSDLPEWAIDYIERLHNLVSGKIINCKRCGGIKLDSRRCDCGLPKVKRPVDPIVWDPFIS